MDVNFYCLPNKGNQCELYWLKKLYCSKMDRREERKEVFKWAPAERFKRAFGAQFFIELLIVVELFSSSITK